MIGLDLLSSFFFPIQCDLSRSSQFSLLSFEKAFNIHDLSSITNQIVTEIYIKYKICAYKYDILNNIILWFQNTPSRYATICGKKKYDSTEIQQLKKNLALPGTHISIKRGRN